MGIPVGKSGLNAPFNLFFPGLGWPWAGESVGFIYACHMLDGWVVGWLSMYICVAGG